MLPCCSRWWSPVFLLKFCVPGGDMWDIHQMNHSCRSNVKCIICNKRHYAVLCSKLPLRSGLETESASTENSTSASSSSTNVISNQACTSEVLLQTLVVVLKNGNR
ncbi:hypothetical protein TNCT_455991 [Trichonephila clavata]|uniref:Secreted protein n=1 Tax=Trichonephila clavata TaxID=2740835 RepID=A0A8X6HFH2_TRICU|nr:hypothetical protein TNCT_455991 [Trichonephila clavata]